MSRKTFNIAQKINAITGEVFGSQYGEAITVRRPTASDKITISTRQMGALSAYGARPEHIPEGISTLTYILCLLDTLADKATRPDWTLPENVFEEDEPAIYSLFEEVSLWLDTFRPKRPKPAGEQPGQ